MTQFKAAFAGAIGRGVDRARRDELQAAAPGADGDETGTRAGFEQVTKRLEEDDGAESVDLPIGAIE